MARPEDGIAALASRQEFAEGGPQRPWQTWLVMVVLGGVVAVTWIWPTPSGGRCLRPGKVAARKPERRVRPGL